MSTVANHRPTSVPLYPQGTLVKGVKKCLVVTQYADRSEWADASTGVEAAHIDWLRLSEFSSILHLQREFKHRLAQACAGLRLVLLGDEAFVWPFHAFARSEGLQSDEILIHSNHEGCRQVFCVHCSTIQPSQAAHEMTCTTCGVVLEVRNHFSRRLGAYLGVCANPDDPRLEVAR